MAHQHDNLRGVGHLPAGERASRRAARGAARQLGDGVKDHVAKGGTPLGSAPVAEAPAAAARKETAPYRAK